MNSRKPPLQAARQHSCRSFFPLFLIYLLPLQRLAASLPSPKKAKPVFSSNSSLFFQNTRGVGVRSLYDSSKCSAVPSRAASSFSAAYGNVPMAYRNGKPGMPHRLLPRSPIHQAKQQRTNHESQIIQPSHQLRPLPAFHRHRTPMRLPRRRSLLRALSPSCRAKPSRISRRR